MTGRPTPATLAAVKQAHRRQGRTAVLFLDLDNFKPVNDRFGHHCGDTLLQAVAQRLRQQIREEDPLARMGGDEFVVLIPVLDKGHDNTATLAAQRMITSMRTPFVLEHGPVSIGASLGIAIYPDHADNAQQLLERADRAMYRAKRSAQSGVEFYASE